MDKTEWTKNIALVLLGAIIAYFATPNPYIYTLLYPLLTRYIPESWRYPMQILIFLVALIMVGAFLWQLEKKAGKNRNDAFKTLIKETVKETIKELKDEGVL